MKPKYYIHLFWHGKLRVNPNNVMFMGGTVGGVRISTNGILESIMKENPDYVPVNEDDSINPFDALQALGREMRIAKVVSSTFQSNLPASVALAIKKVLGDDMIYCGVKVIF